MTEDVLYLFDLGVRLLIDGDATGGRFSLVEHTLPPRGLGAPLHRHANEDEYSYVVEGRLGAQLGDEIVVAGPGEAEAHVAARPRISALYVPQGGAPIPLGRLPLVSERLVVRAA